MNVTLTRALLATLVPLSLAAQAKPPAKPPAPPPDTLIFISGEQLGGELEGADSGGITFKSPMAGELKVKWANIRELRSDKNFAILTKNQKLTRKDAEAVVPQGKITANDKTLTIATATGPKTINVADANLIVDAAAFDKAVAHPPSLLQGWGGTAQGGISLVRATQNSTTFNGGINLVRSSPLVSWLPARSRTVLDYNQSYGTVSQAGTPTIETNIFHADAERDQYFTPRLFSFGSVTYDHNFASALDLQQAYGGGIGATVQKNAARQLDVKADVHYEKQVFFNSLANTMASLQNQNLFGSTFSEKYLRYLRKGLVLNEFGSISPSWSQSNSSATQPNAYSAHINASLGFPVFKGLGFNVGAVDDYVNNAPLGSKRNSVQYTTNLTFTIKPK